MNYSRHAIIKISLYRYVPNSTTNAISIPTTSHFPVFRFQLELWRNPSSMPPGNPTRERVDQVQLVLLCSAVKAPANAHAT